MASKCAIREVAKDVWTFSCPFSRFNLFPVGARSTAIKLSNGDVWVLASSPMDDKVKQKLNELGPVKWIVGPDAVHHLFLGEFKKEFPDAKVIAVHEAIQKKTKEGIQFDGAWGKDHPDTQYGFEDDIKHCYFSGFKNKDVAFFHPASKTMLQADLLFNLPAREQYSLSGSSGKFPLFGSLTPWMWVHKRFVWSLGVDKEAMRRDVKSVAAWDFERIIPCHGDVIEKDGKSAWMEAYKWYFD
uniref:Multicopper oxidase n=1 Tax=Ganoderma boninense TaxID=34458 RepID=A0A5K1K3T4_9APHY|nr:Multicopper oxidase [Ganoderma boninense]